MRGETGTKLSLCEGPKPQDGVWHPSVMTTCKGLQSVPWTYLHGPCAILPVHHQPGLVASWRFCQSTWPLYHSAVNAWHSAQARKQLPITTNQQKRTLGATLPVHAGTRARSQHQRAQNINRNRNFYSVVAGQHQQCAEFATFTRRRRYFHIAR